MPTLLKNFEVGDFVFFKTKQELLEHCELNCWVCDTKGQSHCHQITDIMLKSCEGKEFKITFIDDNKKDDIIHLDDMAWSFNAWMLKSEPVEIKIKNLIKEVNYE